MADLADGLGHAFSRPALLAEALTHRSAAAANGYRFGYERLEFLGDRVLGLVVSDMLLHAFPDEPEGVIARRFTALVRREALAQVAEALDLGKFLYLSEAEDRAGGRANKGLQADACEAVIGALYLDGGLDTARAFVLRYWRPLMHSRGGAAGDPKTRLQEWVQARGLALPAYRILSREGPAHEPVFTVEAVVAGQPSAKGRASSKRAAEQAAASDLLARIEAEGGHERR